MQAEEGDILNITDKEFVTSLARILGKENLILDPDRLRVYETDGLTAKKQLPCIVVLPETIEQIQGVMKLCSQSKVPVVARGAGTGLSGGALPHPQGVLLGLSKFNRILSIDDENLLARVEPGVTNLAISEAVRPKGLYYAPDPSSQLACTIGGNVAENAGGVHCLKYGLTVHNVSKLKIVSPEGELYTLGSEAFDSPGLDLLAVMHGSEGLLGIVVEVTVKLLSVPESVSVVLAGFDQLSSAADAVSNIIASGSLPAGLEMMDKLAIQAAEAFVGAGYPLDVEAILICELDGTLAEVKSRTEQLQALLLAQGAKHISAAYDEAERLRLWQGRKAAFPAMGRISPDYYCMDGTIPRKMLGEVLNEISRLSRKFGLAVANVFHAGDGNLHPLILYDANSQGEIEKAEAFGGEILALCIRKGGTITGEHGVGVEKIDQMCLQFTPEELSRFHGVKESFDEHGILNPGKAVPTLQRCAEFGAMHVKAGQDKFPHLERF